MPFLEPSRGLPLPRKVKKEENRKGEGKDITAKLNQVSLSMPIVMAGSSPFCFYAQMYIRTIMSFTSLVSVRLPPFPYSTP